MGCHALLQRILPTQGSNLCLLCLVTGRLLTTSAPYTYICSFSDLFSHLGDYRILSRVPCVHSRSFLVLSFVDSNVNGTGFFVHEADSLREEGGAWNPSNPQTECSLSALLQRLDGPSPAECPRAPAQPPPAECPQVPAQPPAWAPAQRPPFGPFLRHVSVRSLLLVRSPPRTGLQESSSFPPFRPSLGWLFPAPWSLLGSENQCSPGPPGVSVTVSERPLRPSRALGRHLCSWGASFSPPHSYCLGESVSQRVLSLNQFSFFLIYLFLTGE